MKFAIENKVQIYEQEYVVKIFWRKEFLEDLGEFAISPSVFEQPIRKKFYC